MGYLQWAMNMISIFALVAVAVAVYVLRRGRLPARPVNWFCAALCAVAALLNLAVAMPWVALPWALCVPLWVWGAIRKTL